MSEVNKFEKRFGDALVEFSEKENEKFLIIIARRMPQEGKRSEPLTAIEEKVAVDTARSWYEAQTGRVLLRFHKDPLAGGMRAQVPPKGQMIRTGQHRAEVFGTAPGGQPISQGKVGALLNDGQPIPGNIERGNNVMLATAAWVGEFL